MTESILFEPIAAGLAAMKDFAGFVSHSFAGLYDDYCGPLIYSLDPDPCDHLCLSDTTVLTLDTSPSHAGGSFSHTL